MNVFIEKNGNGYTLKTDNNVELMVVSKHDLNGSYRIVDYRLTSEYTTPTEYLSDLCGFQRISYDTYLNNKELFNFPVLIVESDKYKGIKWRDMEGILLEGADRKDKVFDFKTESFVWSYRSAMKILKECKSFWENFDGSIDDFQKTAAMTRPTECDFW